jgi:hypothetical protein
MQNKDSGRRWGEGILGIFPGGGGEFLLWGGVESCACSLLMDGFEVGSLVLSYSFPQQQIS